MCQCLWVDGGEFLTCLRAELLHFVIVEAPFDFDILQAVHLVSNDTFPFDISFILDVYLRSFCYFLFTLGWMIQDFLEFRNHLLQFLKVQLWSCDEVFEFTAIDEWGRAERFQCTIDVLRFDGERLAELLDFFDMFLLLYPPVVSVSFSDS